IVSGGDGGALGGGASRPVVLGQAYAVGGYSFAYLAAAFTAMAAFGCMAAAGTRPRKATTPFERNDA
ncbi:MAG: hypothetical protein OXG51_08625, partial [Gammaproteobacteria bacterium]|nr:hypothetical protein [Gammaproteobacteria bacterium]